MSIASTTTQKYIPGFEANISAVVTPLITAPQTTLTNLINGLPTILAGGQTKHPFASTSRANTEVSPYPLFAIWTNQDNSRKAGYSVINSEFQVVATGRMANRQGGYTDVDLSDLNNWYEDFRGWTYTNGNPGGGGNTTHCGGGTNMNGADGNHLYSFSVFNNYSPTNMNRGDQWGQFTKRCGTIIGAYGVRQRVSHYTTDSEFQIRGRGIIYSYVDRVDLNSTTYANWAGKTNRGMSSYNDRTKTLCIAESNTSNAIRLHVWKNVGTALANGDRSLNNLEHTVGNLHLFFSEAKTGGPTGVTASYSFYDFTWTSAGSTQSEPAYVMRLTMGDNGTIGFTRYSNQSNAQQYGYFVPTNPGTPGNAGIGTFTDTGSNLGNTTSYSIDQGDSYGIKSNITWSNKWQLNYSVYHYYHNGINAHCINTYDPTKYYTFRAADTSNGVSPVPFRENDFLMCYSVQNGDSPGPHMYIAQPEAALENGRRADNSTITNGGDLQPFNVNWHYMFDTMSNTTQYPHISVMPHWVTV